MIKYTFLLLTLFSFWHKQKHSFEIKFFNSSDSCVRTIDALGIEKVDWASQKYTIRAKENVDSFIVYWGSMGLYFDKQRVLDVRLFDVVSSLAYPKNECKVITDHGRVSKNRSFRIYSGDQDGAAMDSFLANKQIPAYLKSQGVEVQ